MSFYHKNFKYQKIFQDGSDFPFIFLQSSLRYGWTLRLASTLVLNGNIEEAKLVILRRFDDLAKYWNMEIIKPRDREAYVVKPPKFSLLEFQREYANCFFIHDETPFFEDNKKEKN